MRRVAVLLTLLFAAAALVLTVRAAALSAFADNGVIHGNHTSTVLADNGVIDSRD